MFRRTIFFFIAGFFLIFPALANAQALIFDYGPLSGTDGGSWSNEQSAQNFAEQFSFPVTTTVTRVDIFTDANFSGSSVHIKILSDAGGTPAGVLRQEDQIPLSWTLDTSGLYRVSCNLAVPFVAQANTVYWIGVAGNGIDIHQESVLSPGDGHMAQFNGSIFSLHTSVGDMMFQLYSGQSPVSVPSMTEWGMIIFILLAGLGSAIYMKKQKKAKS
jgi:hypothetical protein